MSYLYDMKRFARVNARFDETAAEQLQSIVAQTKLSASEVLKRSVAVYYEQLRLRASCPQEIVRRNQLIGCAEAGPNLSSTYKKILSDAWSKKHGHRR